MANTESEKKALILAEEMKELLEKWILKSGPECNAAMERVAAIKREINSFGFWVDWSIESNLDTKTPKSAKVIATVTLSKPRPDLAPEFRAIYDQWFKKMNGIE